MKPPPAWQRLQDPLTHCYGRRYEVRFTGVCEACGKRSPLAAYDTREWYVLGPLPVAPAVAYRVLDECPLCRRQRRLPLAEYRAWVAETVAELAAALAVHPDNLALRLELAWRYYGLGCFPAALATLEPLRFGGDQPPAARHARAVIWRGLGRLTEAVVEFNAAVVEAPNEPLYRLDLARALMLRRRGLALAEHHLQLATEQAPDDLDVWLALAHCRTRRRRWPAALAAWRQALRLDPDGARTRGSQPLIDRVKARCGNAER